MEREIIDAAGRRLDDEEIVAALIAAARVQPTITREIGGRWTRRARRCAASASLVVCAFMLVGLAIGATSARAAITVNSANDFTHTDGACTLREALAAAAAPGSTSPDCPGASASGTTTITLAASPLLLSPIEIPGAAHVALAGAGPDTTAIAPNGSVTSPFRAFVIDSGATVSISGVTIAHFRGPAGSSGGQGTSATTRGADGLNGGPGGNGGDGGAILNAGTLTLANVHLDDDHAGTGGNGGTGGSGAEGVNATSMNGTNLPGGIGGHGGDGGNGGAGGGGGAISNTGTLTIDHSEFSGDGAGTGGDGATGGRGGDGGPTILNSNSTGGNGGTGGTGGVAGAGGSGGAISNTGTLTMTDSTIDSVVAGDAGRGGAGGVGGTGGDGYPSGFLTSTGGNGGNGGGAGPNGGDGGGGGAIANFLGTVILTRVEVSGGAGGGAGSHPNPPGRGGQAGFGDTEGVTGNGGPASSGGNGGRGGVLLNFLGTVTIDASFVSGGAGAGGQGSDGGEPGDTRLDGFRGGAPKHQTDGLPTAGGSGGDGGAGGALELEGHSTLTNTTVSNSSAGGGGDGGTGGNGHSHPGGAGGNGGNGASGGGIDAGTTTPVLIAHDTIDFVSRGISGGHGLGGSGSVTGSAGSAGSLGAVGGIAKTAPTPLTERNSIVDQATGTTCSAGITDGGHNLVFPTAGCPGTLADPKLAVIHDSSDGIDVIPLDPTSPAIDQVPASGANCLASDGRGAPRPQGAACDIGAYERGPAPVCPDTHRDVAFGTNATLRLVCSSASTRPDAGTGATVAVVTPPSHGSTGPPSPVVGAAVAYVPAVDFVGTDSFTYRETSSDGTSNTATVTVTVHRPAAPTFTGSVPRSPSTARSPRISGHYSGDSVSLYASADCSGPAVATGDAVTFASPGLVVNAAPNATTSISARYTIDGVPSDCSTTPLTYVNDTAPPQTTINGGPSGTTTNNRPVFTFSASEPGSTFTCSLDESTPNFRACSGPGASDQPPNRLADGTYTFRVRATDPLGNEDPTPATATFTVATGRPGTSGGHRPNTIIVGHPKSKLTVKAKKARVTVSFRFRSAPTGAKFACKLDKHKVKSCRSPARYKVGVGRHVFTVTAKNTAGADRTPARFRFTVLVHKRKH